MCKSRELTRTTAFGRAVLVIAAVTWPLGAAQAVDRIAISPAADNTIVCDTDGKCIANLCEDGVTACATGDDCKLFYCEGGSNDGGTCNPNTSLAVACPGGTACTSPACLRVQNEDVVVCRPDSTGALTTSCDWSLLFDGSAAGLPVGGDPEVSGERVKSFEFLDDGSIVVQFASTVNGLGNLSTVKDKDLARCAPVREDNPAVPDPYSFPITECSWSLFLNGEGVKAASDARSWDSIAVLEGPDTCRDVDGDQNIVPEECDVLLSLPGGDDLGGVPVFDEDVLRCVPTALSGVGSKTIQACDYAKFLDASLINAPFSGGDPADQGSWSGETFAFDVSGFDPTTFAGTFLGRISNQATNPPHQADKDLMDYTGTFGPTGLCTDDPLLACIDDPECGGDGPCDNIGTNPAGTMTLYLDGDGSGSDPQAGLQGATIDAVALITDGDDDEIPDGADNCPSHVNPPSICTDGVTACTAGGGECPVNETCVQPDDDGDGVGDACDICAGRPDVGPMACECGDGVLDVPTAEAEENGLTNEECDLGALNGTPEAPCTVACQTSGFCTGNNQACFSQDDCTGQGDCCGDGTAAGGEECDDANGIDDDDCANDCTENDVMAGEGIPVDGACSDIVGPNLIPASVKFTKFNDRGKLGDRGNAGDIDKWKTRGEFILPDGVVIDADTDDVTMTFNNFPVGVVFEHTLPDGNFVHKTDKPTKKVWLFKDKEANTAESWRKGKFSQSHGIVKFTLDGRTESMPDPDLFEVDDVFPPIQIRQSIRVGDVCATAIVTCEVNPSGKVVRCESGL